MKMPSFRHAGLTSLAFIALTPTAMANMGNIGTNYGVLPGDVASAQALSLFNSDVSATYYNPAYLAHDERGELTLGLLHADHDLRISSQGGAAPLGRSSDVIQDTPSQQTLIGMKTNLSSLTKSEHPIYFGFIAGVEKYGEEMLAFNSSTSNSGQYFSYGRQPLFLNLGGATEVLRGIDVGLTARVTLHADAELYAYTDLQGNTSLESLNVSAKPSIRPIFGMNVNWAETFCGGGDCLFDGIETALSFRGHSNTETKVEATTIIPGTIPSPGLNLAIATLDAYQPDITSLGMLYRSDRWRLGLTLEYQAWSDLSDEFESDTIKDQANLNFQDVLIPRLGGEFRVNDMLTLTGGVAFQESPLEGKRSLDVNYLDADRTLIGLGATLELRDPPVLAYPLSLSFGYQYQMIDERDFELTSTDPMVPVNPYETVTTEGDVSVFSGSMTMKF